MNKELLGSFYNCIIINCNGNQSCFVIGTGKRNGIRCRNIVFRFNRGIICGSIVYCESARNSTGMCNFKNSRTSIFINGNVVNTKTYRITIFTNINVLCMACAITCTIVSCPSSNNRVICACIVTVISFVECHCRVRVTIVIGRKYRCCRYIVMSSIRILW